MGHPLPVPRLGGAADTAAMNVGEILRETGVPFAPALGVRAGHITDILHGRAETGRTDHGAIGTSETTLRDVVPAGMIEVRVEQVPNAGRVHAALNLGSGALHRRFCLLTDRLERPRMASGSDAKFRQHLSARVAACLDNKLMPARRRPVP